MKRLSILALEDAAVNCIDSCFQILSRVNDFMKYQGKSPCYDVQIVGTQKHMMINNGLYTIKTTPIESIEKTDVIFIPIICGKFASTASINSGYHDWIKDQYARGAEIACLCVGSFYLASTGLLDKRKCAIHWAARNEFVAMYPGVIVVDEQLITDENRIYTCGGGYSFLNLLLYIIEKHLDRDMAVLAAKMFEIDIARKNQHMFTIFIGQKRHGDESVLRAQEIIEQNASGMFSVDELCEKVGVGRRTFERRFRKCTGNSVSEYIQRVKVELAKKQLESTGKTISEVTFNIGYNDSDAFRKIFKKYTDLSPLEYRKRYSLTRREATSATV